MKYDLEDKIAPFGVQLWTLTPCQLLEARTVYSFFSFKVSETGVLLLYLKGLLYTISEYLQQV